MKLTLYAQRLLSAKSARPEPKPLKGAAAVARRRDLLRARWTQMRIRARREGVPVALQWGCFHEFLRWVGCRRVKGLCLERTVPALGYTPDNCIWATWSQVNKRKWAK